MAVTPETRQAVAKENDVIVVDLGTKKRKRIKQLRKGRGKLMDRVHRCLEELKAIGTIASNAIPVVIVVKEDQKATPSNIMDMFGG